MLSLQTVLRREQHAHTSPRRPQVRTISKAVSMNIEPDQNHHRSSPTAAFLGSHLTSSGGVDGGCSGIREEKVLKPPQRKGVDFRSYSGLDESVVFGNTSSGLPPSGLAYLSLTCTSL